MDKEKIQSFLLTNGKYLPKQEINTITSLLKGIEDENLIYQLYSINFKNPTTFTLLYWLCPGFAFIDRFFISPFILGFLKCAFPIITIVIMFILGINSYIDEMSSAFIFLIIAPLYIIWLFIDGFTVHRRVKKYNLAELDKIIIELAENMLQNHTKI